MDDGPTTARLLSEHMITVADIKTELQRRKKQPGWQIDATMVDWNALPFRSSHDNNSGHGSIPGLEDCDICVIGCVDHHVDEGFLPRAEDIPSGQPLLVQPGPGSCTSLVVDQIRSRGLWPDTSSAKSIDVTRTEDHAAGHSASTSRETGSGMGSDHMVNITGATQAAQLALAAILVDTTNLTAKGRVQDVDRSAVSFLEGTIRTGLNSSSWDRRSLFNTVQKAKENSPELLTFNEVLDRDYKEWTVQIPSQSSDDTERTDKTATSIKLGFCAAVKPITWLVQKSHADTSQTRMEQKATQSFLDGVRSFATSRELDIVVVMTAYNSPAGEFRRELFLWAGPSHSQKEGNNERDGEGEGGRESGKAILAVHGAQRFAEQAIFPLGLQDWTPDENDHGDIGVEREVTAKERARHRDGNTVVDDIRTLLNSEETDGDSDPTRSWRRLWRQTDVSKSRKQVAPLLRETVADSAR